MNERSGPKTVTFRAFLVEENPELAQGITTLLTNAGIECYAGDVVSGFEEFQKREPHIVLLGLGLPQIGGAVLCTKVRAASSLPISVLSVRTRREDHLHILNLGADDFIPVRTFDEQLTLARILTLLRRVYRYDGQRADRNVERLEVQPPLPQLPPGWATCEACSYMGPQWRFEKVNARGDRVLICPHCNRAQNLRFTVS